MQTSFKSFVLMTAALFSLGCFCPAQSTMIQDLHSQVLNTIEQSQNIPGLESEEFQALKPGLITYWNQLVANKAIVVNATDKEIRPYFVALQGIIEHVLASELNHRIKHLTGIIHTPMPATPLCSKGEVSPELVTSAIENDPLRLFTVKARTTIVRDYLFKGGDLYIVYPQGGLQKRTEAQQQIYLKELQNNPSHLFDRPLNTTSIDSDLIGATYLFTDQNQRTYTFAIKMTQANNPQDIGNFGLWFGELKAPVIKERTDAVLNFINQNTSTPLPN